jgi:hypothetical protein
MSAVTPITHHRVQVTDIEDSHPAITAITKGGEVQA